jgi:hypothetical protein
MIAMYGYEHSGHTNTCAHMHTHGKTRDSHADTTENRLEIPCSVIDVKIDDSYLCCESPKSDSFACAKPLLNYCHPIPNTEENVTTAGKNALGPIICFHQIGESTCVGEKYMDTHTHTHTHEKKASKQAHKPEYLTI